MVALDNAGKPCRGKGGNFVNLDHDYWSTGLRLVLELFGDVVFGFDNADSVMF